MIILGAIIFLVVMFGTVYGCFAIIDWVEAEFGSEINPYAFILIVFIFEFAIIAQILYSLNIIF